MNEMCQLFSKVLVMNSIMQNKNKNKKQTEETGEKKHGLQTYCKFFSHCYDWGRHINIGYASLART